ncbi:hypothetical protein ZWY2020_054504 [Hordeum vulgare]|nr:hypothetical protein ZWY2020_054504 [Hordeum vulgare]
MCHTNHASDCSAEVMDTLQIMSVKVTSIKGSLHWPPEVFRIVTSWILVILGNFSASYGFRGVFSATSGSDDNLQVKLLDFGDGGLHVDANGVITLSRPVVSVKLERNLKVSVMAFPINKGYAAETSEALLKPHRAGRYCGIYRSGVC